MQPQWTISWFDCDLCRKEDFIWQTSDDQLSGWTKRSSKKHLAQSNLHQKPNLHQIVTYSSCLLQVRFTIAFWIPESHYIQEVSSANQWDAKTAAGIGQQKRLNSPWQHPTAHCTANASKAEQTGLRCFASSVFTSSLAQLPSSAYSPHLYNQTTTSSSISTTFYREKTSTTSSGQKMLSKNSSNPKAWIFMLQE